MTFDEVVEQVRALLQRKGRVAYRTLKRHFDLDDEYIEDVKAELITADRVAQDEAGEVLVWIGEQPVGSSQQSVAPQSLISAPQLPTPLPILRTAFVQWR